MWSEDFRRRCCFGCWWVAVRRALFSGDTIVHPDFWARHPLAHIWGNFAMSLMENNHDEPLFWFLTTKGYKTYRYLPVFFREFYPRHDADTPDWAGDLIDVLATHKYREAYQQGSGLLSWGKHGCRLSKGIAQLTELRLHDPHVQFFVRKNPGHANGDELCCVARLTRENFTRAAYRMIGSMPSATGVVS